MCKQCGNEFEHMPKEKNRKYCSSECYNKSRLSGKHRECKNCGKIFYAEKYKIDKDTGIFCSQDCFFSYRSPDDIDYFDAIDSYEKAYMLGLIFSDGSVFGNKLHFGSTDYELIEYFSDQIGYKNKIYKQSNDKYKTFYSIQVTNNHAVGVLSKYGIVERKSYIESCPKNIPVEFERAFIIGYFDGDGSVTLTDGKYARYSIVMKSRKFAEWLVNILGKYKISASIGIDKRSNTHYVKFYGKNNSKRFLSFYTGDFGLKRKREVIENATKAKFVRTVRET